jgi:hypothetical protein
MSKKALVVLAVVIVFVVAVWMGGGMVWQELLRMHGRH